MGEQALKKSASIAEDLADMSRDVWYVGAIRHLIESIEELSHPRDAREGSGMGLAIVKKILTLHGQVITAGQAAGGAAFRFTWPKSIEGQQESWSQHP